MALSSTAALPAAADQQLYSNNTGGLLQPLAAPETLSLQNPPGSPGGTTDPLVLGLIPLLLAPSRCFIRPVPNNSPLVLIQQHNLTGWPTSVTPARAARMRARHRQRQQQYRAAGGAVLSDPPMQYARILTQHNSYRAKHQAPALRWDGVLANGAATYAAACVWGHDPTADAGENLYASSDTANVTEALANAVQRW